MNRERTFAEAEEQNDLPVGMKPAEKKHATPLFKKLKPMTNPPQLRKRKKDK